MSLGSIPPLLRIPLQPFLAHSPLATPLTSVLPTAQPPWFISLVQKHSNAILPLATVLFLSTVRLLGRTITSQLYHLMHLADGCLRLWVTLIYLWHHCSHCLPCPCSSSISYWVEQSHNQPRQSPKMKPAVLLDFPPIYLSWPINHRQILLMKHWSGSLLFPCAWWPNHCRPLPSLSETQSDPDFLPLITLPSTVLHTISSCLFSFSD